MRTKSGIITFTIILWSTVVMASWSEPQDIVSGIWGENPGQFYFESGDMGDNFPRNFGVDGQGKIFVNDEVNARIQVFNSTGSLQKVVRAPEGVNISLGWPYNLYVHSSGAFVASYDGPQKFFFNSSGNLIKKIDVYGPAIPLSEGFLLSDNSL